MYAIGYFLDDICYASHLAAADKIGVNPEINLIVLSLCEFIGIVFGNWILPNTPRIKGEVIALLCIALLNFGAGFIQIPIICNQCSAGYFQLALIAFSRVFLAVENSYWYILGLELFPVSIRTIGTGISSGWGTLGGFTLQNITVISFENNINILWVFAVAFLGKALVVSFIPETFNQPNRDQIDEVKEKL